MYFDQQSLIQKQLESLSRDDEYSPKKSSSSPPKRKYKPRVKKTPSPNKSPSKRKVTNNKRIDLNLQMLKAAENERIKKDTIIGELYVPIPSKDSEATDSEKTDEEIDDDHDSDAEHYIKTHFHALKNTSMYAQSRELAKETENLPAMVPAIIDGQLRCITEQEYLKTPIKNTDEVTEDEEDEELAYLKMKEIEMLKLHDKRQKEEAMIQRQKKIKEQIIKNTEVQELKKTQKLVLSKKNVIDQNVGMKSPKAIKKVSETNNDVEGKENIKEVITPCGKKEDSIQSLQSKTINDLNTLIRRKTVETFDEEKVDSEIKKKITDFGSSENNRDQPKLVMGMKRKVVDREMSGMPDLKRTRSIDGAKLRSINFIMPLQKSMTQEVVKKDPVLNNKRKVSNENKVDSKSLLKLVTMTKKQPISKPKPVTPVTTQASSGQGDSEKWKNSWRSVLAENKTITVIRDVNKKMSYNEEKLMSVIQAGFLSLGSVISPELSDKTFILVIGSEESEVKSAKMREIVNQAQKRGCKIWNLQKSRRFFKHLDIEVEQMENDYEMMRYIDYAKYKKPVPPKVVEQAITTENKPSAGQQPNKLNEYLTMESKIGNLDRDITARREDYHYFSEEKPHMYLYYKNQQFAPIVSMEWKCPTTEEDIFKEKYDLDALPYPTIKYSYNGRSPFAKRDKEEILYQRAFNLNNRGKEAINIVRHADPNQKTVTKKLIKHRYEKDLVKEDYALMIRRLYSESSVPNAENNVYFFDNYYDKETKQWVPFNNTLSKMYTDHEVYEEKKNLSMNMRKHNESFNTSENVTLQSPVCEKPLLMNVTQSPNKDGTTKYEDLENLSQRPMLQRVNTQHNSEMKASGVLVGTNMGTGTGNGLQPVKNSIISAQMKVLQKRQLVLQKQMALQKQQQKKEDGKSKNGYCEGCRVQYDDLEKHVKSERHVGYKNEEKNFSGIDELIRMISV